MTPLLLLLAIAAPTARAFCHLHLPWPPEVVPEGRQFHSFAVNTNGECTDVVFTFGGLIMPRVAHTNGYWLTFYYVNMNDEQFLALTPRTATEVVWTAWATDVTTGRRVHLTTTLGIDFDRDGWARSDGDLGVCDRDDSVNPGMAEVCDNAVDDDCDGEVDNC
jgi:hypothetical protein